MQPKVSVIVPVYNTEKYLDRCLQSIMAQTLKDIEIVIVDDGSKEGCAKMCDDYAKLDDRIKVIHKANGGLGYARNTGLEAVTGSYVGFVDSDDYIEPSMCGDLYEAATKQGADLVISGFCFVGGNMFSQAGGDIKKNYFTEYTVFEKDDMQKLLLGVVGALPKEPDDSRYGVSVCKCLFRNALLQEQNLVFMSERVILSEDTMFMVDLIQHAKCAVGVPKAYYCYCRNEDSLSKSYKKERFEKSMYFLGELEKQIARTVPKEEYQIYLDRLIQGFGRILCSQEIMYAREHKIKFSALRKRLKEICTRSEIKNVLKSYPWYQLPIKQAVFAFAMKYRFYAMQVLLVVLRDR